MGPDVLTRVAKFKSETTTSTVFYEQGYSVIAARNLELLEAEELAASAITQLRVQDIQENSAELAPIARLLEVMQNG